MKSKTQGFSSIPLFVFQKLRLDYVTRQQFFKLFIKLEEDRERKPLTAPVNFVGQFQS
jgi:hypothetical protein